MSYSLGSAPRETAQTDSGDGLVHGYDPYDPYGVDRDYEGDDAYTEGEIEGLVDYWCGFGYRDIRGAYQGNPKYTDNKQNYRRLERLDKWLDSGAYPDEIYRGVNLKPDVFDKLRPGAVIDQLGPSSWTKDRSIADEFSSYNDYHRVVFIMKGGTRRGRDLTDIPGNGVESEVALSSHSKQAITAVQSTKSGIIEVYVEEVENG